jgi:hypothetical protein
MKLQMQLKDLHIAKLEENIGVADVRRLRMIIYVILDANVSTLRRQLIHLLLMKIELQKILNLKKGARIGEATKNITCAVQQMRPSTTKNTKEGQTQYYYLIFYYPLCLVDSYQ